MSFLEIRNLTKVFTKRWMLPAPRLVKQVALQDLTLTIPFDEPSIVAITGETGSGKTTLAQLLLGKIKPSRGSIQVWGTDLSQMRHKQRMCYRREVQAIFANPRQHFNRYLKVDRILLTTLHQYDLAITPSHGRALMIDALERVGLYPREVLGKYPQELSNAQCQQLMLAAAFLPGPRLIIADEPLGQIEEPMRSSVLESLLRIHRDYGISILYLTQDHSTACHLSKQLFVLRHDMAESNRVSLPRYRTNQPFDLNVRLPFNYEKSIVD